MKTHNQDYFMILKYILYWLPMPIIGIVNGAIRQLVYGQYMEELTAHHISTVSGIMLFGIYVWLLSAKWVVSSSRQAIFLGLTWLLITIVFEFIFGHYVMNNPWSILFHDYNLLKGRIWILILIWISVAPYIFYRLRS